MFCFQRMDRTEALLPFPAYGFLTGSGCHIAARGMWTWRQGLCTCQFAMHSCAKGIHVVRTGVQRLPDLDSQGGLGGGGGHLG